VQIRIQIQMTKTRTKQSDQPSKGLDLSDLPCAFGSVVCRMGVGAVCLCASCSGAHHGISSAPGAGYHILMTKLMPAHSFRISKHWKYNLRVSEH
jgi:hypothetical protein